MSFINTMPVWMFYLCNIIIIFIFIAIAAMLIGRYRTIKFYRDQKDGKFIVLSLISLLFACLMCLPSINLHRTAKQTGANYEHYAKLTYGEFKTAADKSFRIKMPKPNQKGIIVVLYKFNCKDCEQIKQAAGKQLPASNNKIYYVPSKSPYGQKLVKDTQTRVVPSIVYIKRNQANGKYQSSPINRHKKLHMPTVKYYKQLLKDQN